MRRIKHLPYPTGTGAELQQGCEQARLTIPLYRLHDHVLSFHVRVCILCEIATRKSPSITRAKGGGVGAIDVAHSLFHSAQVLRLLLFELINHVTATGWSLSCAD